MTQNGIPLHIPHFHKNMRSFGSLGSYLSQILMDLAMDQCGIQWSIIYSSNMGHFKAEILPNHPAQTFLMISIGRSADMSARLLARLIVRK